MRHRRDRRKGNSDKVGGFPFFLSLLSLIALSIFNLAALGATTRVILTDHKTELLIIISSAPIGFFFTLLLVPEKTMVFIHETKHAILSGLAGNRWKGMQVKNDSGEFRYEYTKQTAHFNAMIALAPYFFPLLTIVSLLLAYAALYPNHRFMVGLVSFAAGMDLFSNIKDIDPRQPDFVSIRGGFGIAILYVLACNTFIFTLLLMWGLLGHSGLSDLFYLFIGNLSALIKPK